MSLMTDEAIVLRTIDYSESSQILVMLARDHGIVRLIAKGIKRSTKKRFAAAIDVLDRGQVVWSERGHREPGLVPLTEWKQRLGYAGLRESLIRLYAAQYAGEITAHLLGDRDPHPGLFDQLQTFLEVCDASADPVGLLCNYQRGLLIEIGLMPQLDQCCSCSRQMIYRDDESLYFSSIQGGPLCRDCEMAHVEKRMTTSQVIIGLSLAEIPNNCSNACFDLLNYHISHLIGKEPRLANFVIPSIQRRTHIAQNAHANLAQ